MESREVGHKALSQDREPSPTSSIESGGKKGPHEFEEAPDGGSRAWLAVAGAAFVTFSGLGYQNSFGVFQQYYLAHQLQDVSADDIAWIGSLSSFLQFAAGAFGGALFDRYGAWTIRPAAVLYVFGIFMTSLCDKYWQLMLAQGVLVGIALGFLLFPAMAAVSQYFDKKRGLALGVVIAGSSVGGVVLPIALSKMLNGSSLGFGWSVRIIGFIMLPLLAFSCLTIRAHLPPRPTTLFIGSAFKDAHYVLLIIALFFIFLGMFTPLFYIPIYAVSRGIDATFASYLLAILNAASTFGRIIPGLLADKVGPLNVLAFAGIINGVVIFCLTKAETTAGLVVYSVAFGFSSGTIISTAAAAFARCPKDPKNIGTYMGMGMAVSAIAALIGPPINGALADAYGGFWQVSIFSGVMCLVGGCVTFASKVATPQGIAGRT